MIVTTEDAKKIAGAYLTESHDSPGLREYRKGLIIGLLAQYNVRIVKELPNDKADAFVKQLLDRWHKNEPA